MIQEALNLLGYDAGSVDGTMGLKTQQAVRKFQADRQLPQTGYFSPSEQQLLRAAVDAKRQQMGSANRLANVPSTADHTGTVSSRADRRMELAHWETVRDSKNPAEVEDYIARYPNGEFTKLAALRLDQLKAGKGDAMPQGGTSEKATQAPIVRAIKSAAEETGANSVLPPIDDASYPKAKRRRGDAVAVIIGNSAYRQGVPPVEYGGRDADAMKLLAIKTLGVDESNIIFLKEATRSAMDETFGTDKDYKGKLWRLVDPDGRSGVFIFYSGHGVPGIGTDGNFLLPVDGDPNHASLNGYPLALLYDNLGKLKTQSVTVFLDACFSGQSPDASNQSLIKQASPVFISKATPSDSSKINVFAAANERQLSSWDPAAGHGIFTRYLLAGLAGQADEDGNKEVTAKELHDFLVKQVRRAARRAHGREQEPQFQGEPGLVLSSF